MHRGKRRGGGRKKGGKGTTIDTPYTPFMGGGKGRGRKRGRRRK